MPSIRARLLARQLVASVRVMAAFTVLLGLLYPLAVWGTGQLVARDQAAGSLVRVDDRVVGSALLGQQWTGPEWFHGRPSASDYSGDVSGGTNLGPGAPVEGAVARRRIRMDLGDGPQPPDALTASASGLDPHISVANAEAQVARVAAARGLPPEVVGGLVVDATEDRALGFLGEERVNVLRLNIGLRGLSGS
ncbi:K(+)-transporting ATPase subunit C [Intrasporangium sp. DVR]|uniref:K(+)-transporting ATPase subunit C n=1 Tax=Intrasporangium sp. DVR TaxID=3127867 RepID=UPI00313A6426